MKEFPATKNFAVGDRQFQVGRMTPRDGSWIVLRLLSKSILAGLSGKISLENIQITLPLVFDQFTEAEFQSLQNKCFAVCSELSPVASPPVYLPLMMRDGSGRWTGKEPDAMTALSLTINALVFNLEPFFDEGAMAELTRSLPGMGSLTASPLTSSINSSGGR